MLLCVILSEVSDGHSPLLLQVVLSDCGLIQSLAQGLRHLHLDLETRTIHICLHNVRMCSFKVLPLMSDACCRFQEKQQLEYEELIQVLKKEQDIYAHLVKSLQDSDR